MLEKLNAWQRFWGLFALVFLASTLALTATTWPRRDAGVVADLRSPDCALWREIPEGDIPDVQPDPNTPCYAIRSFLYREHAVIRSEGDYDSYRFGSGIRKGLMFLAIWAGFMGAIYLMGVAGTAAAKPLLERGKRSAGK